MGRLPTVGTAGCGGRHLDGAIRPLTEVCTGNLAAGEELVREIDHAPFGLLGSTAAKVAV